MGYFDRFRRKKSVDVDEVGTYYSDSRKRNPSIAILLGVLSFIITLALLWLLFLGGRWVYRQIMGNETNKQQTTTQHTANNDDKKDGNGNSQGSTSSTSTNTPSGGNNSQQGNNQPTGNTNTDGNNNSQSGSSPNQATTPALGDNTDLPRTGDEGL